MLQPVHLRTAKRKYQILALRNVRRYIWQSHSEDYRTKCKIFKKEPIWRGFVSQAQSNDSFYFYFYFIIYFIKIFEMHINKIKNTTLSTKFQISIEKPHQESKSISITYMTAHFQNKGKR